MSNKQLFHFKLVTECEVYTSHMLRLKLSASIARCVWKSAITLQGRHKSTMASQINHQPCSIQTKKNQNSAFLILCEGNHVYSMLEYKGLDITDPHARHSPSWQGPLILTYISILPSKFIERTKISINEKNDGSCQDTLDHLPEYTV